MSETEMARAIYNYGIGPVMVLGLLWFLKYRETVAIPRMLEKFELQLDKERKTFSDELAKEREISERHHRDLLAQTNLHHSDIVESIKDLGSLIETHDSPVPIAPPKRRTHLNTDDQKKPGT